MRMLNQLLTANEKLVIGLMSGTSADGLDAVLVKITGHGFDTKVQQLAYQSSPHPPKVREVLLRLAAGESGGSQELCLMNQWLGETMADACEELCATAGVALGEIDLVGSHGHTFFHIPQPENYLGKSLCATLQLGEASAISQRLSCVTVSDFRVRDMAAGGQGAPLVPYVEYLLYADPARNLALQNIGGIGNITFIPKGATIDHLLAFDTGPGNMVMDSVAARIDPSLRYDAGGALAATGQVDPQLLAFLMDDPYITMAPPKTTGREKYTVHYVDALCRKAEELGISLIDALATTTMYTAATIQKAAELFNPAPTLDRLIVGGGGSYNKTLLNDIAICLPNTEVITNEAIGFSSDAKEAVAFAVLANECIHSTCNNAVGATGAKHPVIMGKISQ